MNKFLEVAIKAAKESGGVIMNYFNSQSFDVRYKEDHSPLTKADIEAEKIIRDIITNSFPDHEIFGEELPVQNFGSEYRWIVDPIDGTIKFARGIPLFSTQIGLLREDTPILGLSHNVPFGEIYYALKGEGAFLGGKQIRVSSVASLAEAFISDGGIKHFYKSGDLENHAKLASAARTRGFGDAYAYTLLASGKVDVVIEAKTKAWDVAAAIVLVEEAGGKVTDFQGNPIDLSSDKDLQVIATNGVLHDEVVGYFKE